MALGWGICGSGFVADRYVAPEIRKQPDSHIAAVFDVDQDKAQGFVNRHGGSPYGNIDRLLEDPAVDIVYVASPNRFHPAQTIAALKAGKHVLCEKPLALTMDEGRSMVLAAREAGKLLGVGFHFRHKPSNVLARELVLSGRIGRVFFAEIERGSSYDAVPHDGWRQDPQQAGGGSVFNQGLHTIDTLRFITGKNIVTVSAKLDKLPIDDVFVGLLTLDDGIIASASSHQLYWNTRPEYVVFGEQGWIRGRGAPVNAPTEAVELHQPSGDSVFPGSEGSAYWHEVDDFAKAVLGEKPLSGNGEDGLQAIAVTQAIYRSARENRTVGVEPNW